MSWICFNSGCSRHSSKNARCLKQRNARCSTARGKHSVYEACGKYIRDPFYPLPSPFMSPITPTDYRVSQALLCCKGSVRKVICPQWRQHNKSVFHCYWQQLMFIVFTFGPPDLKCWLDWSKCILSPSQPLRGKMLSCRRHYHHHHHQQR